MRDTTHIHIHHRPFTNQKLKTSINQCTSSLYFKMRYFELFWWRLLQMQTNRCTSMAYLHDASFHPLIGINILTIMGSVWRWIWSSITYAVVPNVRDWGVVVFWEVNYTVSWRRGFAIIVYLFQRYELQWVLHIVMMSTHHDQHTTINHHLASR